MPVPTLVTDLSTTVASNSPAGSDNVFPDLDNYLRALSGFVASIRDNSGNGWVSPYLPLAGGTVTGATIFSSTVALNGALSGTGLTTYLASPPAIGGTTPAAGSFTTLAASGNVTLSSGTANGVLYLNGSKVATSGSALTFDGTNFTTTGYAAGNGLRSLGGNAVRFYNATNANWSQISAPAGTGDMQFDTGAGEQMRLTSTGLGIGTSSPATKLDVVGSAQIGISTAKTKFYSDSTYNGIFNGASLSANEAIYMGAGGQFFVAAGAEQMRLTSTGLGIGTSSPGAKLDVSGADGVRARVLATAGGTSGLILSSSGNTAYTVKAGNGDNSLRIDQDGFDRITLASGGNVGIGTSSPTARLHAYSGTAMAQITADGVGGIKTGINFANGGVTYGQIYFDNNAPYDMSVVQQYTTGSLIFGTNSTERARITSGGDLLVGTTTANGKFNSLNATGDASQPAGYFQNNKNFAGIAGVRFSSGNVFNDTGHQAFSFDESSTLRFEVRSNGGIANYSGNNVNLSDRREKTNFAPAKSYLDTICAIPVQTFEYIDQSPDDPGLTLGVVAQDVQAVAPELVMESNWGTEEDPKMRLSIYQTDLQYALMKCIQELKAQNDELRARVAALEAQP